MATPATGEEKYVPIPIVCEGGVAIFFTGCCIRSSVALREDRPKSSQAWHAWRGSIVSTKVDTY
ncbi:hypothetical protein, partial [Stenotrophomonas maltophilia]|uniref:hypothetical protein n=1 Tax=Stenotrophomonas maltophilia TaxID=40324 RepID=UPI002AFFEE6F